MKKGGNYKRHWSQKKTKSGKGGKGEDKSLRDQKKRMKSSGR